MQLQYKIVSESENTNVYIELYRETSFAIPSLWNARNPAAGGGRRYQQGLLAK